MIYLKTNTDWKNTLISVSPILIQGPRREWHSTLTTEDKRRSRNGRERDTQFCRNSLKRTHSKSCTKCDASDLLLKIKTNNSVRKIWHLFFARFNKIFLYLSGWQLSTQAARSSTTLTQAEHWSGPGPVQPPRQSSWQLSFLLLMSWQTPALQHLESSQLAGQLGQKGSSLLPAAMSSPLWRIDPQSTVST